jgi:acyl-coenzyme A synthetase/AMP-(fatty) acid ligase
MRSGPDGGDPRRFSFADLAGSSDRAARFLAGQGGHVAVRVKPERPVGMFTGYWRDPEATAAAFRIGPFEVESALVEHPAAVVGKPDPQRGQIVKAFVVLAPGHEDSDALAAELQEHCRTVTAAYKYPREIEFTVELPKTISGKIRRVELRERVQAPGA